jgi:hypothetical protein
MLIRFNEEQAPAIPSFLYKLIHPPQGRRALFATFSSRMAIAVQQAPVDQRRTFITYLHALMQSTTIAHSSLSLSLQHQAQQIYTESFVEALRPTLLLITGLLVFGIVLAFSVRIQGAFAKKAEQAPAAAVEIAKDPQPTQAG